MWSLERNEPLKACPVMSCRRERKCFSAAAGGECAITHYCSKDEWYGDLTARIIELQKHGDPDPATRYLSGEAKASAVYKALQERAQELGIMPRST